MAATSIASLISQIRVALVEPVARFWSDQELVDIMNLGAKDLWGMELDLHQDHWFKITTDTILRANETEISGIPEDCFRIQLLEAADTTQATGRRPVLFVRRKYKSPEFAYARSLSAQQATDTGMIIYYQAVGEGAPTGPPKIVTAPKLAADLRVRLQYTPTIPAIELGGTNPIPGESDNALKAWTIAFARAKETEGRIPDAGWLGIYKTEKENMRVRMTPRDEHEPDVVDDLFQNE